MGKKLVRMEVVMDVSRPERTDEVIQRSLYGQNMLSSCMRPLIEAESVVEASRELLAEICRFYGSEEGVMLLFPGKEEWLSGISGGRNTRFWKRSPFRRKPLPAGKKS